MTLIDFVLKAKRLTYASGEGQQKKFEDGSVGFEIESDGFRYIDRYYGSNPFSGSERVYGRENNLLWMMNYYGGVFSASSDPKEIYAFLKEAMLLISPEYPFRGPAELKKQNLRYENLQHGSFAHFHGVERIYDNNDEVYVLHYHGGKMNHR